MVIGKTYKNILEAISKGRRLFAILIDPEKFELEQAAVFLRKLPTHTTHLFVGGSTVPRGKTEMLVQELKLYTSKPIVLFPGDSSQITATADALLFLSLLSGDNPEFLIHQQLKAVATLRPTPMEVIPTAYILIDGGNMSAVERVTNTKPIGQNDVQRIADTAKAAEYMGKQLIYLEAGSGALKPVSDEIISEVKKEIEIPLIVGGGIRTDEQMEAAYDAGANMVVMGTAFENHI